jgi:hypothetical protein
VATVVASTYFGVFESGIRVVRFGALGNVLLAAAAATVARVSGQQGTLSPPRPIERAEYQVKVGVISAGSGVIEVVGKDTVNGYPAYHIVLSIEGGVGPARVSDRFESWGDAAGWDDHRNVFARRFIQDQRELGNRRQRRYEMYPETKQYKRVDTGEMLPLNTDQPLDDVAVLYFARSLPLKVGDTYEINRYFKADANPIVLRVVRRETITVPAGTFETVVVKPIIKTSGLFGEGGEAELFFSDDKYHTLIRLRSKVKLIGSLSLHLRKYDAPADSLLPQRP